MTTPLGVMRVVIIGKYKFNKTVKPFERVINCGETVPCPICRNLLTQYDWRVRKLRLKIGCIIILIIRRLRCEKCGKLHNELPDCVVPYKRYCAETVEAIIANEDEQLPCENRTIRRLKAWWNSLYTYFFGLLSAQEEKYGISFNDPLQPKETVRIVVNTHNWKFTRSAYAPV